MIDAHMHLWNLEHGEYPWLMKQDPLIVSLLGDYNKICHDFLIEDYLALIKSHHIKKCIHIEAHAEKKKALLETMWVQKQADTYGFPQGIVASVDLRDSDLENVLKDQCQFPNIRGIRQTLIGQEELLIDYRWQKGLKLLSKYNLSFDLEMTNDFLDNAIPIVKEYSDVRFILDHFGLPQDVSEKGLVIWKERLERLREHSNAYLKLSGIGFVFQGKETENRKKFLRMAVEIFGEDRCLFGSNMPVDSLFLSFEQIIEIFKDAFSDLDEKIQHKLFYENANEVYQL